MRYALHASPDFNARLHWTLQRLAADLARALGRNLVALVLGGGYGRGEGAVVRRNGLEQPYNDLDFALVVRRPMWVSDEAVREVSEAYARQLGVHVDFTQPLTVRDIRRWPCCLMWSDFLQGHVTLAGPSDLLRANAPPSLLGPLPSIEATRLLLNRGAGLLWAMRVARGVEGAPDDDFVRRNYYKCALALGDAVLIMHERFTTRYTGRDARLAELARECGEVSALALAETYERALAFKLSPDDLPLAAPSEAALLGLAADWARVLLYVERARTGLGFDTIGDYQQWTGTREVAQNGVARWPRNLLRNLGLGRISLRYPREELFRAIPGLLLGGKESERWDREGARFLQIWQRCS